MTPFKFFEDHIYEHMSTIGFRLLGIYFKKQFQTTKKKKFSIKDIFSKCDQNTQETADLVTFIKEILNGKLFVQCHILTIALCTRKDGIHTFVNATCLREI